MVVLQLEVVHQEVLVVVVEKYVMVVAAEVVVLQLEMVEQV